MLHPGGLERGPESNKLSSLLHARSQLQRACGLGACRRKFSELFVSSSLALGHPASLRLPSERALQSLLLPCRRPRPRLRRRRQHDSAVFSMPCVGLRFPASSGGFLSPEIGSSDPIRVYLSRPCQTVSSVVREEGFLSLFPSVCLHAFYGEQGPSFQA